jgi:glycerophosphoryl diester phosphodiesterase
VVLFIAMPKISRSPPTLVPVPPSTVGNTTSENITAWLDAFAVMPILCHSHNDYWRPHPLLSALMVGCTGIEADVWLSQDGQDLVVGHDRAPLTPYNSLRSMYLDPLFGILESRNMGENNLGGHDRENQALGVFTGRSESPVVLMIDVKENATAIWKIVLEQLSPFRQRGFLRRYENGTIRPGPLVVVGSGQVQLDTLLASSNEVPYSDYHDTFLDAPLKELSEASILRWTRTYNTNNSYYASSSFTQAIGSARAGFSERQLRLLRWQIQVARSSGLYSRYWEIPEWPINYRDYLWNTLTQEGVGMLSVDDVNSAAKQSWTTNYLSAVDGMTATCCMLFFAAVLFGYALVRPVHVQRR